MRTTGATDSQVEAAARRRYNVLMTGDVAIPHMTGSRETFDIDMRRHGTVREMNDAARHLVRPDQRIVDVADLRSLAEFVIACNDEFRVGDDLLAAASRSLALLE